MIFDKYSFKNLIFLKIHILKMLYLTKFTFMEPIFDKFVFKNRIHGNFSDKKWGGCRCVKRRTVSYLPDCCKKIDPERNLSLIRIDMIFSKLKS